MATENLLEAPGTTEAPAEPQAFVYLLCFAHNPYKHAKHYLGATWSLTVAERVACHRGDQTNGRSAKLMTAVREAGGTFVVADVWDCETKADALRLERLLKSRGGAGRVCSVCNPGNRAATGQVGRRRKVTDAEAPKT